MLYFSNDRSLSCAGTVGSRLLLVSAEHVPSLVFFIRHFLAAQRAREGKGPLEGVGPEITYNSQRAVQNTEYIIQLQQKTHVHKITNVPVFFYYIRRLDLMEANPFLGRLEGVGPRTFWAQMARNGFVPPSKSLRPAPYKQQVH